MTRVVGRAAWSVVLQRGAGLALVLSAVAVLGGACASQGAPPGGPPDVAAPRIVGITPDTGTVGFRGSRAVFRFDEVVSERPRSVATLGSLFLISPRDGEPDVDWDRDAITVKPRRGWRPNTVYSVTMLPGLVDLRGNARTEGATVFFSTGSAIPRGVIAGTVSDWVADRPAIGAFVEAVLRADSVPGARRDSTVFVTSADSSGAYRFGFLAPGRYLVRATVDANANRVTDTRELWDSTSVALLDSGRVDLALFVHDTIAPRIGSVEVADSVTLRVQFDKPLDGAALPMVAQWTLRAPDSSVVRVDSVRLADAAVASDSVSERANAAAAADSARTRAGARRARPVTMLVLRVAAPLRDATTYRLEVRAARGLLGATAGSLRSFTTRPAPAPTPAADSVPRATPDARDLRLRPDPAVRTPPRPDSAAAPTPRPPR